MSIVVVGGGPAGSTCARLLAQKGHAVVLLDKRAQPQPRPVETCGPRAWQLITQAFGNDVPATAASPLARFSSAWGGPSECYDFRFWQAGSGALVDRPTLDLWMLSKAADAGVDVRLNTAVVSGTASPDRWTITTQTRGSRSRMEADFVVEAAGAITRSPLRSDAGRIFADGLMCVTAEFEDAGSPNAEIESAQAGWWFTAARTNGTRSANYFTDASALPGKEAMAAWFSAALHRTVVMRARVGGYWPKPPLETRNARTSLRRKLWSGRWVTIGDAALTMDPLSGGGMGRAVADGIGAAEAISLALATGDTCALRTFALSVLHDFEQALHTKQSLYQIERRWAAHPFWSTRS